MVLCRRSLALPVVFLALVLSPLAKPSPASALPAQFYGLTSAATSFGSPSEWDVIQHSGASLFRAQFSWGSVNAAGWQNSLDPLVGVAAERGVTILPYIYGRKTSAAHRQFYLKDENPQEWREWLGFVQAVVERYGFGGTYWTTHPWLPYRPIRVWEVWNEPNLKENNPGEKFLPRAYAEFLIATSKAIRKAQDKVRKRGEPETTAVLFGGINQEVGEDIDDYLGKASGVKGLSDAYDGLSIHPYSLKSPSEKTKMKGVREALATARSVLDDNDGKAKSLWITELGWPVAGKDRPHVTLTEQANLLTTSYTWLGRESQSLRLQYVSWYFYRDIDSPCETHDPCELWDGHAGLLTSDGSYRPAWDAYRAVTGAPPWPLPPQVQTSGAGSTETTAFLQGDINPNGLAASYRFEYGTTPEYGQSVEGQAAWTTFMRDVARPISGLAPGTTYHYRLVATNAKGTAYGQDRVFTTLESPAPPPVEFAIEPEPVEEEEEGEEEEECPVVSVIHDTDAEARESCCFPGMCSVPTGLRHLTGKDEP